MIQAAIQRMLADATLTGLVGRNKALDTFKIYPVACPQDEVIPYITCGLTSAEPVACKGVGGLPDEESFDVVIWDTDYERLDNMGVRVIEILNNALSGTIPLKQLTFLTHRDALDQNSKLMVRIVSFRGSR
jgi:hypothetical protein